MVVVSPHQLLSIQIKTAILVGTLNIGVLAGLLAVTSLAMKGDVKIDVVGFACAGLNIVMYGSPLAAMVRKTNTLGSVC